MIKMNIIKKILAKILEKDQKFIAENQNPEVITRKMKRIAGRVMKLSGWVD